MRRSGVRSSSAPPIPSAKSSTSGTSLSVGESPIYPFSCAQCDRFVPSRFNEGVMCPPSMPCKPQPDSGLGTIIRGGCHPHFHGATGQLPDPSRARPNRLSKTVSAEPGRGGAGSQGGGRKKRPRRFMFGVYPLDAGTMIAYIKVIEGDDRWLFAPRKPPRKSRTQPKSIPRVLGARLLQPVPG